MSITSALHLILTVYNIVKLSLKNKSCLHDESFGNTAGKNLDHKIRWENKKRHIEYRMDKTF